MLEARLIFIDGGICYMRKRRWGILLIFFIVFLSFPAAYVSAAPELKVTVSAGIDGKVKYGRGAPVSIIIENNGSAFSGDLIVDVQHSYENGVGEVFPIDIGEGESKTISFVIPKMYDFNMYNPNNKSIYLYEGGWKNGKEIAHKGAQQINAAMYHDDTKLMVAFTDNMDRLTSFKGIRTSTTNSTQLINATKISKFPDESVGWETSDIIIVDEYPIADLTKDEQEEMLQYVQSGGMILFGGSDHIAAEAGVFAEFLPIEFNGKTSIEPQVFNEFTSTEGFDQQITMNAGTLRPDAKAIFTSDGNVLVASKEVGRGLVIQTAFSIGDEPLSKATGGSALWMKLLDAAKPSNSQMGGMNYYDNPLESLRWTMGNSNELFPSFKVSAPVIIGIIIAYIVLIIPVLYFILKRKDKREHAWWIIPAIAVSLSIFIFAYGARERIGKAQIQQTAVMEADQSGKLSGYFVESILTNKAGDFVFEAPKETVLSISSPVYYSSFFGVSAMGGTPHKQAILERDATGQKMHVRDIGYWNVSTLYGQSSAEVDGNYSIDLTVANKQLTGTITNNFPFSLKDVAIWSGNKLIAVGDLGPGESKNINETLKTSTLLPKRSIYSMYMGQQPANTDDLKKMRKDSIISYTGEFINNQGSLPAIIGYTDTQLVPVNLSNAKASMDAMTMVIQSFKPTVEFSGEFSVDPEMMEMTMISDVNKHEAYYSGYQNNMYYFDEQVYVQTWKLPEEMRAKKFKWKSLEISGIQNSMYSVSVWNEQTEEFEKLEEGKRVTLDSVGQYLSKEGEVKLRLDFVNQNGTEALAPQVRLNGEVTP